VLAVAEREGGHSFEPRELSTPTVRGNAP
jgi:hypothetical protein